MPRRKEFWIQRAIQRKGSLKHWLKKHYGKKAFRKDGKVKISFLRKLAKKQLPKRIKQKINLALTLHKLRRK